MADADAPGRGRPPKVKESGGVVVAFGNYVSLSTRALYLRFADIYCIPAYAYDVLSITAPGPDQTSPRFATNRKPRHDGSILHGTGTGHHPEEDPEHAADTDDDDNDSGEALGEVRRMTKKNPAMMMTHHPLQTNPSVSAISLLLG